MKIDRWSKEYGKSIQLKFIYNHKLIKVQNCYTAPLDCEKGEPNKCRDFVRKGKEPIKKLLLSLFLTKVLNSNEQENLIFSFLFSSTP